MPVLTSRHTTAEAAAQKLRREIVQAVRARALQVGDRVLSERKLAERLGVSYMTARKALSALVADGLLERRPRQGVFVGSAAQQAARGTLKRVRGLIYLDGLTSYYADLASGLQAGLGEAGVEIAWTTAAEFSRAGFRERLGSWNEDAYLTVGQMPGPLLEALRSTGRPVTVVDHVAEGFAADHAVLDNEGVGFAAAERFFAHGRRRVAYLGGEIDRGHPYFDPARANEWPNSLLRGMGVRRAYVARGLEPVAGMFRTASGGQGVRALAAEWFGGGPRPEAAVCFNAYAGWLLLDEARARGLRVPEDFAVVGLGVPPEWAGERPEFAHFNADFGTLGREGARLCLLRHEEPDAPPRRVVVPWTYRPGPSAGWTD
ncbi:MAG: GntR family transcriptional regulator [Planctomycetota bacterium]|nr:GntR family transcriptional regulator [Planctomycetota bacterium]